MMKPRRQSQAVTGIVAVAQSAGVATSTVSRILGGGKPAEAFSAATRKKVMKAAAKLRYIPNSHARRLVRGKADNVALVTRSPAFPFFGELVDEFVNLFAEFHIRVSVAVSDSNEESVAEAIRHFGGGMVDAIFVCPSTSSMKFGGAQWPHCPVVSLIHQPKDRSIPHVSLNIGSAARRATDHLLEQGRRRIGFVGPSHEQDERIDGYMAALHAAGLQVDPAHIFTDNFFQIDRSHDVGKKLRHLKQPPDALFVASDLNAIGVIHGLVQAGFSVPEDVAVISHDGIRLGSYYRPALTTMAVPWRPLAERCAKMLQAVYEGATSRDLLALSTILESTLLVRESSVTPGSMQRASFPSTQSSQ